MSWGLLTRASSGWRRVIGRVLAVVGRVVAAVVRGPRQFTLKGPSCIESSSLHFGTGPDSGVSKRLISKGRASTESSFLGFGTGPGV